MLKRLFVSLVGILALGVLSLPVSADAPTGQATYVLAWNFDLDSEAADADQVVVVGDGVVTVAPKVYNLTANPDVCRLVDVTYVNGGGAITAGTLTVTGTDCWGDNLVTTLDLNTASGVKNLVVPAGSKASGAYYGTITDIRSAGVVGATGAETITVGYTTMPANQWVSYGKRNDTVPGYRAVDPAGTYPVSVRISQGAGPTLLTATTAATAPFTNVAVGDIIYVSVKGAFQMVRVTAKADNDNLTINTALSADAGSYFSYAKRFVSSDPIDGWLPVGGWDAGSYIFNVAANADVGGVVSTVECAMIPGQVPGDVVVDTDTIATGATGTATTAIDFRLAPFRWCRFGLKFGTNDDGDAANEQINVALGLRK